MKKTVFLLLATLLSVCVFGQTSSKKEINVPKVCTITIPCQKADSAQAYIEKGFICEKELKAEQKKTDYYQKIVVVKDSQVQSLTMGIAEKEKIITENDDKILIQAHKIKAKNKWILGLGLASIVQLAIRL